IPPRDLVPNVPADLAAICRQALRKNAAERYQTAGEFAQDLRRWLQFIPTVARPARTLRRVGLWARRNKGWAAAIACTLVGGLAVGISATRAANAHAAVSDARADAADARAEVKEKVARIAEEKALASQRDSFIQQLQRLRLTQ